MRVAFKIYKELSLNIHEVGDKTKEKAVSMNDFMLDNLHDEKPKKSSNWNYFILSEKMLHKRKGNDALAKQMFEDIRILSLMALRVKNMRIKSLKEEVDYLNAKNDPKLENFKRLLRHDKKLVKKETR